jgi:hypothetical protein
MHAVSFFLSFDNETFTPDIAAGEGEPQIAGKPAFAPGVAGQSLLIGEGGAGVLFRRNGNFPITRRGAISMWICPQRWDHARDDNVEFLMTSNASFYLQRQGPLYRPDGQAQRLESLQLLCLASDTGRAYLDHSCSDWKNNQWHLVAANWNWPVLELSVDGAPFQAKAVINTPTGETFGDLVIGAQHGPQTLLDEVTIYRRPMTETEVRLLWQHPRLERPAPQTAMAAPQADAIALQFKAYPTLNQIKVKVDVSAVPARDRVTGAKLLVTRAGATSPVTERRLEIKGSVVEQVCDVPLALEGDYTLSVQLEGGEGVPKEPVTESFERRVFPWENNQLGISDHVIPPFTPLKVDGQRVRCVLREHVAGASGLWDQVVSQDRSVLVAPMRWEVVSEGNPIPVVGRGWRLERGQETEVAGEAEWTAGIVRGTVRTETDYDGMTKFTLTLPPASEATVDRLTLVAPILDSVAPYAHACADQLRYNFAGRVPAGEGVVWDSGRAGRTDLVGTFFPYVWVGGGERGLCWFADNDRDWSLDDSTPTVELVRSGHTLELRVHFITRRTRLDRTRRIVFGLQATPVKPMPSDWRKWQCSRRVAGSRPFSIVGATFYYGCLSYDFYPAKHDLMIYRKMSEARETGQADMRYVDTWLEQHLAGVPVGSERHEFMRRHVAAGLNAAATARRADGWRLIPYTNVRGIGFHMVEWPTFQDEWHKFPYFNRTRQGQLDYDITPTRSFQDATLWYYREMMQVFDGIYWDNTFLAANWDTVVGGAWVDESGRTHPGLGLWAMRELIKRTAVLFHQEKRDGLFVSHMTNANLVPVNAFANVNLDWEWKYGVEDFQDRFAPELTVAETIGRQTGSFPLLLAGGLYDPQHPRYSWVMRTRLGVMLVHELRAWDHGPESEVAFFRKLYEFGYGEPDCRVCNYWDADHPVTVSGVDARTLALARNGRALVIVTDYGDGGQAEVTLDRAALGLPAVFTARDFETGESVSSTASGHLRFPLQKHDFKAVLLP